MSKDAFRARLEGTAAAIESLLDRLLSSSPMPGEIARPPRVLDAMRYAMLGGGKRLRPHLVVETARLFGREDEGVLRAAAAVECVHGYSLVHDDLPAMDDDELRRGKPTVHRAFDVATAILAGDGLLTLAFDMLADTPTDPDPAVRIALVLALSRASGLGGMVGGQMLDLEAEGRFAADGKPIAGSEEDTLRLQAMKTGAILAASVDMGAIIGRAEDSQRNALAAYGRALGQAFQVADDLLDAEGEADLVGKATGKDAARGKATLVSLYGVDGARSRLRRLVDEARDSLTAFGPAGDALARTAVFVAERQS
ncbi:polyprenyl synthetase family protein [Enterovirga rhinocerotis]|uniref:Probable farnesyl diphosphate synthase n=1 Tax=Enterovirga rhinocerotis TaxID=1339210 RepID=A0A4R7C780_9HYPH|nr:farnesyl diphosphate synthase [Enterovirga rhinocerotis]TDR94474.1 farnesyl diphosphate synthase [Enterovirga rhinocerotis]